jgi:hypothetical protein
MPELLSGVRAIPRCWPGKVTWRVSTFHHGSDRPKRAPKAPKNPYYNSTRSSRRLAGQAPEFGLDGKPVEDAKSAGYFAVWEDDDRRHKEIGEAIERLSWPITIAKRIALESSLVAVVSPKSARLSLPIPGPAGRPSKRVSSRTAALVSMPIDWRLRRTRPPYPRYCAASRSD